MKTVTMKHVWCDVVSVVCFFLFFFTCGDSEGLM